MRPSSVARKTDGSQGPQAKTKASPCTPAPSARTATSPHPGDGTTSTCPRRYSVPDCTSSDQRAHGTARHQHAALWLEQCHRDVAGVEVRIAHAKARGVQHLERVAAASSVCLVAMK